MADKEKEQEKDHAFTGTPEEKLPDLEAENLDEKQEEQTDEEAGSGEEDSGKQ